MNKVRGTDGRTLYFEFTRFTCNTHVRIRSVKDFLENHVRFHPAGVRPRRTENFRRPFQTTCFHSVRRPAVRTAAAAAAAFGDLNATAAPPRAAHFYIFSPTSYDDYRYRTLDTRPAGLYT